jgi:hypothetical protein
VHTVVGTVDGTVVEEVVGVVVDGAVDDELTVDVVVVARSPTTVTVARAGPIHSPEAGFAHMPST